jgi:hypothetical protein
MAQRGAINFFGIAARRRRKFPVSRVVDWVSAGQL